MKSATKGGAHHDISYILFFRKVACFGFLLSLTIELLQLPFAVRASDVDDLLLNTQGCMVGYGLYSLIRGIIGRRK